MMLKSGLNMPLDLSIDCFQFSKKPISLFFPNSRAKYLIYPIDKNKYKKQNNGDNDNYNKYFIIRAKKAVCGRLYSRRYFGFMLCDYKTTETIDCVSHYELKPTTEEKLVEDTNKVVEEKDDGYYNILVTFSSNRNDIKQIPSSINVKVHKTFLLDNIVEPVIVYREICVDDCEGLFTLQGNEEPAEVKKAMGEFYPSILHL